MYSIFQADFFENPFNKKQNTLSVLHFVMYSNKYVYCIY